MSRPWPLPCPSPSHRRLILVMECCRLTVKAVNSADIHCRERQWIQHGNTVYHSVSFTLLKTDWIVIQKQKELSSSCCKYGNCLKMCLSLFMCNIWPPFSVCCGTVALNYLSKHEAPRVFLSLIYYAAIRTSHTLCAISKHSSRAFRDDKKKESKRVENISSGGL